MRSPAMALLLRPIAATGTMALTLYCVYVLVLTSRVLESSPVEQYLVLLRARRCSPCPGDGSSRRARWNCWWRSSHTGRGKPFSLVRNGRDSPQVTGTVRVRPAQVAEYEGVTAFV